jgi:uncharacterized protein (DUF486 family)
MAVAVRPRDQQPESDRGAAREPALRRGPVRGVPALSSCQFHPFTRRTPVRAVAKTAVLLVCSNVFMTFAWYAHLRNLRARPLLVAVVASWGIAFFEYLLQVPANRIGYGTLNLSQLKVLQEVITLLVFVPFAVLYMRQPVRLDFLWAGLCLVGAVYFVFRG